MDFKISSHNPRPPAPMSSFSDEKMDFDEDSSSEMEFDEDAIDFDGNDTHAYFIVKPFDDAAEKMHAILNNTLAWMKRQDKGPTTESEIAYLFTLKIKLDDSG